jgi:eukaryotic-like serine/threonine-protein kinase
MLTDLQRLKRDTESGRMAVASGIEEPASPTPAISPAVALPEAKAPAVSVAPAKTRRLRWAVMTGAGLVVVAAAVGGWLYLTRKAHALSETDTVVLADFANSTGDAVFDDTLKQGLSVELSQSPFLNIVSDQKVAETLKLMGRPRDQRLTPEVARELCQRAGSKAYLSGSIASLGSQYVIGLNAVNCQTGDSLAKEQVTADSKEHVLKALDEAATTLREKVGESLRSIQKFDTPIEQATTPSFEALKAYSLGYRTLVEKGSAPAIPFYKRAIELDPNFAMACAGLGMCYWNLSEPNLARKSFQKAYELRDRVSERERFRISAYFYSYVTEELDKGNQTYELWAQAYPRDATPRNNLGVNSWNFGQYERALAEHLEAVHLNPDYAIGYAAVVTDYVFLNRLNEAKATYEQALALKLEFPYLHLARYGVAFLQDDAPEMQRQVAWAMGKPGVEDIFLGYQSSTEAYFGHMGKAREFSRRAVDSAQRSDERETAAGYEIGAANTEADYGNSERARQGVAVALSLAPTRDVQAGAAMVLARAGDSVRAEKMTDQLAKQFPQSTIINSIAVPTLRAAIEINRKNPPKAIEFLQTVAPYELGRVDYLYSAYLRGLAYLLLRQGNEAAAEFQRILDHRSIVQNNAQGALAHLGLARAYALVGDTAKARVAYQDFFTLWKDADPDIPILREAKAEYAKLK